MNKKYWQPCEGEELEKLFQKSIELRKQDAELLKAANAGREILAIPEIVKSCLFFSLGKFHKTQGDYLSSTTDYFYSIFHSAVAICKVHFDTKIIPENEFNPNIITVKRNEITKFIFRLTKEGLVSKDFQRTYESLRKRRDHVNYQPRVILSGEKKGVITFFACQYGNLTEDIDNFEPRIVDFIFETAEILGHVLHFYCLDDPARDITATLMFKNWSKICLYTYQYWGARVTSELEGSLLRWDATFRYNVSDKNRKALVPIAVMQQTEEIVQQALEILKTDFFEPRIALK
jgi:hypothetical protein